MLHARDVFAVNRTATLGILLTALLSVAAPAGTGPAAAAVASGPDLTVSQIIVQKMESLKLKYPTVTEAHKSQRYGSK